MLNLNFKILKGKKVMSMSAKDGMCCLTSFIYCKNSEYMNREDRQVAKALNPKHLSWQSIVMKRLWSIRYSED